MRKLISWVSAAALASSMIVPISAGAADDVYSYDGSDASGWVDPTDNRINATVVTDDLGDYTKITTSDNGAGRISYNLPTEARFSDSYVIEYDVNTNKANGMGRYGQYNQVAFISSDAVLDANDFGPYAEGLGSGNKNSNTGIGYTTGVASSITSVFGIKSSIINYDGTAPVPSDDDTGVLSDNWYRVQAAIAGEKATVTVIKADGTKVVDGVEYKNSASKLEKISVSVGRGDDAEGPGTVLLDNIKIYEGDPTELTTDGLRSGEETIVTPQPEEPGVEVVPIAKAATNVVGDELRISDGTNGAVFKFDVSSFEEIESAKLVVKAAPRSYKSEDHRWENTGVMIYTVKSSWNGEGTNITGEEWKSLSKDDPIATNWSTKVPDATGELTPEYQTLDAVDVTDIVTADEDKILIFAFKASSAREHAIDVVLEVRGTGEYVPPTPTEPTETEKPGVDVEAVAKAATKVENEELRISDGTNGAVFRFDVSGFEEITKAKLKIEAAPRSYNEDNHRWESAKINVYKVGSDWNSDSITNDEWNKLSKNDPIEAVGTTHYTVADSTATPPYQKLNPIDVTDIVTTDEDGIVIFAFKTQSAREHAIDAVLEITAKEADKWTVYTATYKDGVLDTVTMDTVDDPATVEGVNVQGTNNEDGTITKKFLWLGMTPYVAPAAE